MPDRILSAAKLGSDKVIELLKAITAGREPPPTEVEWASLREFWQGRLFKERRAGQHKSMTRYFQGVNRRSLRHSMEWIKIKLHNDPAEQELKRAMRANRDRYVLNRRVAQRMHERLVKAGKKNIPSVAYLENALSRSDAMDDPHEPW